MADDVINQDASVEKLQDHLKEVGQRVMENARQPFTRSNEDQAKLLQTLASIFSENEKNEGVKNGK